VKAFRHWSWFLLLVPIAFGLIRLRFNVEVLDLLPADVPAVRGLKIYQQNFANARELIITVRAPNPREAEAAARLIAETLSQHTALTAAVSWQPPWIEHPAQAAEFIAYLWLNQPPEIFGQLTNRLAPAQLAQTLGAAREQLTTSMSPKEIALLSYDPLGLTRLPPDPAAATPLVGDDQELFASSDGAFRLIFVEASEDLASYRACIAWLEKVKHWVQSCRNDGGLGEEIVIHYTGRPAFVAEIAGGMEHDITSSVGSTILIIIALFWWAHRRWRPLLWMLGLLALVLGTTLALGGLFFGTLNVVSVGFAAILLGLAVDYGLVLYQELLCSPHSSPSDVRRILAPGIIWSAVTTAGAFLILNLGGLPGLAQLGSLVAIGVSLAAVVMLNLFLPPLVRADATTLASLPSVPVRLSSTRNSRLSWSATALALAGAVAVLWRGLPTIDHSANSLRPRHSSAYATLEEIKIRMHRPQEPYWLLVGGQNETQIARRLDAIEPFLQRASTNHQIGGFTLPTALWPRPEAQSANRLAARRLAAQRESVGAAARANGFTGSALAFTDALLNVWQQAGTRAGVFWPTNELSRWILEKFTAQRPTNLYALGLIYPASNALAGPGAQAAYGAQDSNGPSAVAAHLPRDEVWLAGWDMLGSALLDVVEKDFWRVLFPMTALLLVSLGLAFRRLTEVLLSLFTLAFSLLCLLALMKLAGWSWNLLNLMALPLLLGTGVDYGIHVQLALRRHGGDIAETRHHVGRALFLCAGTTVAGFGSNVWSSNGGLVSLGQVCAAGIGFAYLTSTWLLPVWWKTLAGRKPRIEDSSPPGARGRPSTRDQRPSTPSHLYRADLWRLGLVAARKLPPRTCV